MFNSLSVCFSTPTTEQSVDMLSMLGHSANPSYENLGSMFSGQYQ